MSRSWRLTISKFFLIPQRLVLGIMGSLAILNAHLMRVVLSVAIIEMVLPANGTLSESGLKNADTCSDLHLSGSQPLAAVKSEHFYNWSETIQGIVLSSFYWGYLVTQLPGGILAEKFSSKYTLGLGILSTAIFTLITPSVIKAGDWQWLVVIRILVGFGEGFTVPALNVALAKWTPFSERSTLGTLVFSGGLLGNVVGNAASGLIISSFQTWESVFYVFGFIGVIWFMLWVILCYSSPKTHPFITEKERIYLEKELAQVSDNRNDIPWTAILTSVPLWALVVVQLGHDWGFTIMVSNLPKYMKSILKFNVKESGIWSSLPYLIMWIVSLSSAALCDWLIRKQYVGVTFARKFFTTIASLGPGIFILAASYAGCDQVATVVLFTVGMGFMGTFICGLKINTLDLSTNFAGTLMAIVNIVGSLGGIGAPYITGVLTEDQTLSQWRTVFWITLGVFVITNIIFIMFGSGEEQWWNVTKPKEQSSMNELSNTKNGNGLDEYGNKYNIN